MSLPLKVCTVVVLACPLIQLLAGRAAAFYHMTPCYVANVFINLQHQYVTMGDVQAALLRLLLFRMCALPLVPVMLLQADRSVTLLLCSSALSRSLPTKH